MPPKKHSRTASHDADDNLRHPTTKRAKEIDQHTPFEELTTLLSGTNHQENEGKQQKANNVLHWFRSKDLRLQDNKALHAASQLSKQTSSNLITAYIYSPTDMEWHGTSPARIDFILESLRILQKDLESRNIPLAILTAEERKDKIPRLLEFINKNEIGSVLANFEYEVDELRRDIAFAKKATDAGVSFDLHHDQTAITPGELKTGGGGPHKVFTPYHKMWLSETKSSPDILGVVGEPEGNGKDAKDTLKGLFGDEIPSLPDSKNFASDEERDRLRKLWPAGNQAGMERLETFLKDKISNYAADRSEPAKDPSSRLSPYFAAGVISVREVLARAKEFNKGKHFDEGEKGINSWVREIVFREFYRHVIVTTPHIAMNLPQNLKFDFVQWEDDEEGWKKWCEGKTGVPFVDAGMRQLNHEAYMHNRLRMNTSSYLSANLLIDYRRGERYFAEHLIDWDMCNNTQGWEPSYTVFNPVVQGEKCDKDGEYIRKWVPELKDLKGKDIFDPFNRLGKAEFEKLGYPAPHVDFAESRDRAKARYKQDLADADP